MFKNINTFNRDRIWFSRSFFTMESEWGVISGKDLDSVEVINRVQALSNRFPVLLTAWSNFCAAGCDVHYSLDLSRSFPPRCFWIERLTIPPLIPASPSGSPMTTRTTLGPGWTPPARSSGRSRTVVISRFMLIGRLSNKHSLLVNGFFITLGILMGWLKKSREKLPSDM